ncbi:hypothetical protein [Chryseobacterium sp. 2R14A]|uniref:hypothetical protein n=1 Tax=Chryseobacterium sp. 2R14A TaxID=3380353 RepID=UPI003CE8F571
MKITIHLPVTPAIKKYLVRSLLKEKQDYILNIDDWFGLIVINMLEYKGSKHYNITPTQEEKKTETFDIHLSISAAHKNGFTILPQYEVAIFNIVDRMFRESMYKSALINKNNYGIDYQTTINDILDSYDITEEEMTYDAIKRDFDRKKEKLKQTLYL